MRIVAYGGYWNHVDLWKCWIIRLFSLEFVLIKPRRSRLNLHICGVQWFWWVAKEYRLFQHRPTSVDDWAKDWLRSFCQDRVFRNLLLRSASVLLISWHVSFSGMFHISQEGLICLPFRYDALSSMFLTEALSAKLVFYSSSIKAWVASAVRTVLLLGRFWEPAPTKAAS